MTIPNNSKDVIQIDGRRFTAFSSDGHFLVALRGRANAYYQSNSSLASVYDATKGKPLAWLYGLGLSADGFSRDVRLLATGHADHNSRVFEIRSRKELSRLQHQAEVTSVAFNPDGQLVASVGQVVKISRATTGQELARVTHSPGWWGYAIFNSNGRYLNYRIMGAER